MLIKKLNKKFRKLSNAHRYRYQTDRVGCFWHLGNPNFGDDLNPYLFEHLLGKSVYRETNKARPHFFGVGSILERANQHSIVAGSGFIRSDGVCETSPAEVLAVRGELTQAKLGKQDLLLGDPGILVPTLLGVEAQSKEEVIIVPHVDAYVQTLKLYGGRFTIIDPSADFAKVITNIAKGQCVLSQSLHGLVMADGMGIPNMWLRPHGNMIGGEFKFADYYSSTKLGKNAFSIEKVVAQQSWQDQAFVSEPKVAIDAYLGQYKTLLESALLKHFN